jgi:UrcA family protein
MRTAFIALSALALATGAQAKDDTFSVRYDDLNLASVTGQKKFEARIERAVRDFCSADEVLTGTRVQPSEIRTCLNRTRASARQQMAAVIQRETMLGG